MKEAVAMIYLGIPPLIPEAVETMGICEQAGMKIGLVTHSPRGRIDRMVKGWGLDGKVPAFTESTLKRKGPEVWLRAVAGLGIVRSEAVAVDDNLGSIRAAREAGIETLVWVKPKWDEYAKGNVPEGILKIEHIGQLVRSFDCQFRMIY